MADWADIDAIRDYLNRNEGELRKKPAGAKVVDDFRRWYADLNIVDRTMRVNERVSEAKWYRDRANVIMGQPVLDPSTYPTSDAPPAQYDPTPKPPLLPLWFKVVLGVGAAGLVYHFFSSDEE